VIVVTEPRTVFTFNERPARLTDFRVGTSVRINFIVRNRTTVALGRRDAATWSVSGPDVARTRAGWAALRS
jgi:hypothetical protein